MYTPRLFAEERVERIHDFIEQHSFGVLVSTEGDRPEASHLPFLLDRTVGPYGQLLGHMARANSHWRILEEGRALTIFHGPHAYVSPTWYEVPETVPTWNYVAVHARGTVRAIEDRERLREILGRTVQKYEAGMPVPWTMDQLDPNFVDELLDAIVGFTVDIERFEGKWKLNQNHERERRELVIRALSARPGEAEKQIADLMEAQLVDSTGP